MMTDELVQKAECRLRTHWSGIETTRRRLTCQGCRGPGRHGDAFPVGAYGQGGWPWGRIEHLFVNLTLIVQNSTDAGCVEYLSTRAAEML